MPVKKQNLKRLTEKDNIPQDICQGQGLEVIKQMQEMEKEKDVYYEKEFDFNNENVKMNFQKANNFKEISGKLSRFNFHY